MSSICIDHGDHICIANENGSHSISLNYSLTIFFIFHHYKWSQGVLMPSVYFQFLTFINLKCIFVFPLGKIKSSGSSLNTDYSIRYKNNVPVLKFKVKRRLLKLSSQIACKINFLNT